MSGGPIVKSSKKAAGIVVAACAAFRIWSDAK